MIAADYFLVGGRGKGMFPWTRTALLFYGRCLSMCAWSCDSLPCDGVTVRVNKTSQITCATGSHCYSYDATADILAVEVSDNYRAKV